jgi:hypothetical protein
MKWTRAARLPGAQGMTRPSWRTDRGASRREGEPTARRRLVLELLMEMW